MSALTYKPKTEPNAEPKTCTNWILFFLVSLAEFQQIRQTILNKLCTYTDTWVVYNLTMFSFISFRQNINYLLPSLLNFWKPDTLPRITNCYDVHAYMPQQKYLAFIMYIITVYTSLYYILKHKISKRNNIYMCDGKHRPEHFLFIHKTKFHNKTFTASQHPSFQM